MWCTVKYLSTGRLTNQWARKGMKELAKSKAWALLGYNILLTNIESNEELPETCINVSKEWHLNK